MTHIAVPAPRQQGFTLVEMAITLAVGGILLALALPSFTESRANGKIRAAAAQMQQDLQWARAEAIKRNGRVGVQITSSANGGPAWTVFADNDNSSTLNTGDTTLRQTSLANFVTNFGNSVTLEANGTPNSPVYASLGNLANVGNGTYRFGNPNTSKRWLLVVGAGGRIVTCLQSATAWRCYLP